MKRIFVFMLCLILLTVLLTACANNEATDIISDSIKPSNFPMVYRILDVKMIDIDFANVGDAKFIEAEVHCETPDNCPLKSVLIYDGWHAIQGRWERKDSTTIKVRFQMEDLQWLDGTNGLHFVMIGLNM